MIHSSQLLTPITNIRHGFFSRYGGVSCGNYDSLNAGWTNGDDIENIIENRSRIADKIGAPQTHLLSCWQIHSPDVVRVSQPWHYENRPKADAMVTNQPNIALGVLTADCVPVLFVDSIAGVIGAAHAGWRGALAGVLQNTVAEMLKLGAKAENISAAIGPCIWQDSYEVSPDFPDAFIAKNAANTKFFKPSMRENHWMFDLPAFAAQCLNEAGISSIEPSLANTFTAEQEFFSYRRNTLQNIGATGNQLSAIMLTE